MAMGEKDGVLFQQHHIKIMKVALALAIIRQKPPSTSALDFTLSLTECFKGSEVTWKSRAQELERELLRTRQELASSQLQATLVTTSRREEERGKVGGGMEREGLVAAAGDSDGSGFVRSTEREGLGEAAIEAHVQFCTSASRLINVHNRLPVPITTGFLDTIKDTLLESIRGLQKSLSTSFPSSHHDMLASAISYITDFLCQPEMAPVKENISEAVLSLAETLINANGSELTSEQVQWAESSLVTLSRAQVVLVHVTQVLTEQLCTSAHQFGQTLEGEVMLDCTLVDRAERQTAMLQTLLTKYDAPRNIESEIRLKLVHELEDSILELSGSYPLFTYAVWKIIALLTK